MQNNDGNAVGMAALFNIDLMPMPDIKHALIEWFWYRV